MRAVSIVEPGKIEYRELPIPKAAAGTVLVRVLSVGLCGSDLTTFRGQNPMVVYPIIPGHEIAGEIVAPGEPTSGLPPGMLVTVMPYTACGSCPSCRAGSRNACRDNRTMGVRRPGAATELIAVPVQDIVTAEGLSIDQVTCIEPLAVGWHAADRARVARGEVVLVMGCGVVGLGVIASCALRGAVVIAVDVDDAKLERARRLGARSVINSRAASLPEAVRGLTDGDGPAVCIEASGSIEASAACVELAAFCGRAVFVGYAKKAVAMETKLVVSKELEIRGSRNATRPDFQQVAAAFKEGRLDVAPLITHRFPLMGIPDALAFWDAHAGEVAKIVASGGGAPS
jgi:L-galactonate 5-dehydrogenase